MSKLTLRAQWADADEPSKKDYAGPILSINSRLFSREGHIPPEAAGMLVLWYGDGQSIVLAETQFEAETEADVQRLIEVWAQQQMDRVVAILREHFEF